MTIGDKIKQALHMDSSKKGEHAAVSAAEGQTGPDAYQPLKKAEGSADGSGVRQTATGAGNAATKGTGTAGSTAGGATGSHYGGSTTGSQSGGGLTGQQGTTAGSGARGATGSGGGSGTGTGTGSGLESESRLFYKVDEPGYSSTYKHGTPEYKEKYTEGDGKWNADLSAGADNENWKLAQQKIAEAEREAAHAKLSGQKASKEYAAAEEAELAVRKAQAKHREALLEAEKYRSILDDPKLKEADLQDAQGLYNSRLKAAQEAEQGVKGAERDLAGRKADLDKLHSQVDSYGGNLPGLENEYKDRLNARQAAEADAGQLASAAQDAENARGSHAANLARLEKELQAAEQAASVRQQEYIDARNRAQQLGAELEQLRARLREEDQQLLGLRNRAQDAEQNLPAYREAEQRALRDLENAKSEWYRLRELEDEYARNFNEANNRYKGLQGRHEPASKDLLDAQSILSARQDDLDRARSRSASAEKKYRELLALADRHKHYGDTAAQAAQTHGAKYQEIEREAEMHGDRHAQLWEEAKSFGNQGSSTATSEVHKLQEKVKELMHKNEA